MQQETFSIKSMNLNTAIFTMAEHISTNKTGKRHIHVDGKYFYYPVGNTAICGDRLFIHSLKIIGDSLAKDLTIQT